MAETTVPLTREELDALQQEVVTNLAMDRDLTCKLSVEQFDRLLATARVGIEDRERLDWLEQNEARIEHRCVSGVQRVNGVAEDADAEWWEVWIGQRMVGAGDSPRVAIDIPSNSGTQNSKRRANDSKEEG